MFAIECCGLSTLCYIRVAVGLRLALGVGSANMWRGRMYITWHLFLSVLMAIFQVNLG